MTKIPADVSRLYLDTNIFIYLLEGQPKFADPAGEVFAEAATKGITLVTSEYAICECLVGAHRRNDPDLIKQYDAFFKDARKILEIVPAHSEILSHAPQIAGSLRLKLLDALHVSAALVSGCDGFLTNDTGIPSIQNQLQVIQLTNP